jgi:hypothetical protein
VPRATSRVSATVARPSVPAGDGELVLGVEDALLELPAVGGGLAPLDPLELRLRLLELLPRPRVVDLLHVDGVVHERDRAVELDLEEPGPRRELEHVLGGAVAVDPRRARLQRRDEGRVAREHADLPGRAGDDQHLRLAPERLALGRDERDVELRVDVGHRYAAAAAVFSAFSTAISIVPTM